MAIVVPDRRKKAIQDNRVFVTRNHSFDDYASNIKRRTMKVNRAVISIKTKHAEEPPVHLKRPEALAFVWKLTEEIYSLSGRYDVKSRLQRDVITVTRKQC
jgi:hypothetical protein